MKSTSIFLFPFSTFIIFYPLLSCFQYSAVGSSNNIINQSCSQAAKTDPNFTYEFCVAVLEENPKSLNASLEELVTISILLAKSNSTGIASKISQLLTNPSLEKYTRDCLEACLEVYSDAKSDLMTALRAFSREDYGTANIHISAAMDAPETCEDGFKEKEGVASPCSDENSVFFRLTALALALLSLCHS